MDKMEEIKEKEEQEEQFNKSEEQSEEAYREPVDDFDPEELDNLCIDSEKKPERQIFDNLD